ncbi:hypothetical protein D3C73_924250 [compost metagenome]
MISVLPFLATCIHLRLLIEFRLFDQGVELLDTGQCFNFGVLGTVQCRNLQQQLVQLQQNFFIGIQITLYSGEKIIIQSGFFMNQLLRETG